MKEFNSFLNSLIENYLSAKEEINMLKKENDALRAENQHLRAESKKIGLYKVIANAKWSANLDDK